VDKNNRYMNKIEWDECICLDCEYTWNASETDSFNFTSCEMCMSNNIGGEYNKNE